MLTPYLPLLICFEVHFQSPPIQRRVVERLNARHGLAILFHVNKGKPMVTVAIRDLILHWFNRHDGTKGGEELVKQTVLTGGLRQVSYVEAVAGFVIYCSSWLHGTALEGG